MKTRMYTVYFAHKRFGGNWLSRTVAVNGRAEAAIRKAMRLERDKQLSVEQVILKGEESE